MTDLEKIAIAIGKVADEASESEDHTAFVIGKWLRSLAKQIWEDESKWRLQQRSGQ